MTAPTEHQILDDTGGLLVTDDGRRALAIAAFVLGVGTLVVGGFGLVALIAGAPSRALGAIFVCVGLVLAAVTFLVVRKIRRRRSQPLHECRAVAVIDRELGLFSYRGGALVQLDQVRFARKLQIGSSSPKLVAVTPGGTTVLKRGNPFDGGIGNVDEILTAGVAKGLSKVGSRRLDRARTCTNSADSPACRPRTHTLAGRGELTSAEAGQHTA